MSLETVCMSTFFNYPLLLFFLNVVVAGEKKLKVGHSKTNLELEVCTSTHQSLISIAKVHCIALITSKEKFFSKRGQT